MLSSLESTHQFKKKVFGPRCEKWQQLSKITLLHTEDQSCPMPQTVKAQAPAIKIKVTECSQETAKENDAEKRVQGRSILLFHKDLFKRQVRNSGAKNQTVPPPSSSVIVLIHNASGDGALR